MGGQWTLMETPETTDTLLSAQQAVSTRILDSVVSQGLLGRTAVPKRKVGEIIAEFLLDFPELFDSISGNDNSNYLMGLS